MTVSMAEFFTYGSYYIITLLVAVWVWALVRLCAAYKNELASKFKASLPVLICSVALAAVIFFSVCPELRVLNDEVNLLSVSRSMADSKTAVVISEAIRYHEKLDIKATYIDKRPLLFPYLTSVLHTVLGYRIANVFVLNFVGLVALLSVISAGLRRYLGTVGAMCCLLLVVSHPIVSLTAASGSFDLFSVAFVVICLAGLWAFLRAPSALSFQFLWLSFVMLSNIRYESFIYFAVTLILLLISGCIKLKYFRNFWVYLLTVLFFVPLVIQRIITRPDTQVPEGDTLFSFEHFFANNVEFAAGLLRFDFYLLFANIIILLGVVSLLYFLCCAILRRWGGVGRSVKIWVAITCAIVVSNWVIITSYYHPLEDVVTCRFYILFCLSASVLFVVFLRAVGWLRKYPVVCVLVSVFFFLAYHPVAVENEMFKDRAGYRRNYKVVCDYLSRERLDNILTITYSPKQLIVAGYGAIGFDRANRNSGLYLRRYRRRFFEDIYVVQEIDDSTGVARENHELADVYNLQAIYELRTKEDYFIRISKVVNER